MYTNFLEFIECVIEARFGFEYIWQLLVNLYYSVTKNPDISFIWDGLMSAVAPIIKFLPYCIMAFGLFVCLFGKKVGGVLKFALFFLVGFSAGIYYLVPLMPSEIPIAPWVVGLVVGIVAAVAYKFLFVATCSVGVLYSVYRLCYYGFFISGDPVFTTGKALTSLAVAAIVLILVLILFKYVEMLLFSVFGSWVFMTAFTYAVYDIAAASWVAEFVVLIVIALIGFLVQVRTRRRY